MMFKKKPVPQSSVPKASWQDSVSKDTSGISTRGYLTLAMTLGLFAVWGFTFPISGAVVAGGKLVKSGQNKLLQLPSNGVVKQILANDGDRLAKGDVVAIIEPASAIADLAQLSARRDFLLSARARLAGGSDGDFALRGIINGGDTSPNDSVIYSVQKVQLSADQQRFDSELSALENQLEGLRGELDSSVEQTRKTRLLVERMNNQYRKLKPLADAGHIAKSRLWDVEAQQIELETRLATLEGNTDNLVSRIEETQDRKKILSATRRQDVSRELTEILTELASIEEQIDSANKVVESTRLRAPADGVLTNMTIHTEGGVVAAGEPVAEIVPDEYPLQVEARILPADINSVSLDQPASINVTALNARLEDPIEGRVSYVAADSQLDQQTGQSFFLARIALEADDATRSKLKSGMDAQVFIETGERTFFSYALQPVSDSFRRAFRER